MKAKKVLASLLAVAMVGSLAACGGGAQSSTPTASSTMKLTLWVILLTAAEILVP